MASGDKLRNKRRKKGVDNSGPPESLQQLTGSSIMEELAAASAGNNSNDPSAQERIRELEEELKTALVKRDDGVFAYKRFQLTTVGVELPEDLDTDEWIELFTIANRLLDTVQWLIGDLIRHASMVWGESYKRIAEITGYKEQTLRAYAYVASNVDLLTRVNKLSFSHHRIVASLDTAEEQAHWLNQAIDNGWSSKQLAEEIRKSADKKPEPNLHERFASWKKSVRSALDDFAEEADPELLTELADELEYLAADLRNRTRE